MRDPRAVGPTRPRSSSHGRRRTLGLFAVLAAAVLVAAIALGQALLRSGDGAAEVAGSAGQPGAPAGSSASASPSAVARLGAGPTPSGNRKPGVPSRSDFPNADDTGVPAGTTLKPYRGRCTITAADTIIEAKTINCPLVIKAKHVVIRKSRVNGTIRAEGGNYSLHVEDSEVDAGRAQAPAVGLQNVTVLRSDIHGGQASVNCYSNCLIQDSWLHGQYLPPDGDWHLNAFLSNGGSNIRLIHNTLACDNPGNASGGGCTSDAAIFGDFGPNSRYTFDSNLFVASKDTPYCTYGGLDPPKAYGTQVDNIVYTNNVFQRGSNRKCGTYGPVTSFDASRPGNLWRNNVWDDGTPVAPAL